MEIKASELRNNGIEVDLPIDWNTNPSTQETIKYNAEIKRYVITDIKTGETHFMSETLTPVIKEVNNRYELINDIAVED